MRAGRVSSCLQFYSQFLALCVTWFGAQWIIVNLISGRNQHMRYVDAGGCMKSLWIVPKQRGKHEKKKKKKMTNSFFLLPLEGSLCFWCLSTYKVWLSFITFLRKYELPIWALWRAGNLTLNPMFWSIKGERKESNPGRWKVWKSDHEKRMLREDSTFKIVLKEWKQTFFCFLFSFLGYWETNQFLLLVMNFVCYVTRAAWHVT